MMTNPVITIDGPAASGKSSVSRGLAKQLGWNWLSSGAFYRGLAYVSLQEKIDPQDVSSLVKLSTSDLWRVEMTEEDTLVFYRDRDVTEEVKKEDIGSLASRVSPYPEVREVLLAGQRACAERGRGLVAEGRDCGSVVFPQAVLKIFLTARSDSRAARRAKEQGVEVSHIAAEQKKRDEQDSSRSTAPLQMTDDGVLIDTSQMGFEEVLAEVHRRARQVLQG